MTREENIHRGIIDWLMRYTAFQRWWFGPGRVQEANISVIPIPGGRYLEEWVGGGGVCEYRFAVGVFQSSAQQPYLPGRQTEAVDVAFDVQAFMAWIEAQNEAGELPKLGEGLVPCEIRLLQGTPGVTGENDRTQKMLFSAAVRYYEIKE